MSRLDEKKKQDVVEPGSQSYTAHLLFVVWWGGGHRRRFSPQRRSCFDDFG